MSGTLIMVLNTLVVISIVVSAIIAVQADKLIHSVIALDAVGALVALEFILLQAPDVAIAEASVGAVLSTVLYIVALRKVGGGGRMKLKKAIGAIALIAILICGIYAAGIMYQSGSTYDGSKTDVIALYENPQEYDVSNPDGVADIIVKNNLDKTVSHNVVASIVFNFRGYDTMGESFILVTAVTGSLVILRKVKKDKKEA